LVSMYEPLIIAATAATGVSLATPKEYDPALSLLLSVFGIGAGLYSIHLATQDQPEAALSAGMTSVMFGLLNLAKSLGLV